MRSNTNQVADWLPDSFSETDELAWYREHFVGDHFVVVSWEGCQIAAEAGSADTLGADPRIERLALMPDASSRNFYSIRTVTNRHVVVSTTGDSLQPRFKVVRLSGKNQSRRHHNLHEWPTAQ